jgi:hypothetical protein
MNINSEQILKEKLRQLNESQLLEFICFLDLLKSGNPDNQ